MQDTDVDFSPVQSLVICGAWVGFGIIPTFFVVTGIEVLNLSSCALVPLLIHLSTRCMRGQCEAGGAGDRRGPCAQLTAGQGLLCR